MKPWWLAMVAVALASARPALACDDIADYQRVVGVAIDGSFVVRTLWSGGVDCTLEGFELRDPQGVLLGRYVDEPDSERQCAARVRAEGQVPFAPAGGESANTLEARLVKELALAPLVRSTRRLVVQQDFREGSAACLNVLSVEREGYVSIWKEPHAYGVDCAKVSVKPQKSPRSRLIFLSFSYARPGGCSVDVRGSYWLSPAELEASRTLHRAELAFRRGDDKRARELAEAALALSPTLIPARLLLARSLARAGFSWQSAQPRLEVAVSPGSDCRGGHYSEWSALDADPLIADWAALPDFESWLAHDAEQHDRQHPNEPSAHWRRP